LRSSDAYGTVGLGYDESIVGEGLLVNADGETVVDDSTVSDELDWAAGAGAPSMLVDRARARARVKCILKVSNMRTKRAD
jgi:hypothetical protein